MADDGPVRSRARWAAGMATAVAAPLASLGARLGLGGAMEGYPYITFFPAIVLAAYVGGRWATLLAFVLSAGLARWFLMEPAHALLPLPGPRLVALVVFGVVCLGLAALMEFAWRAEFAARAGRDALQTLNAELERRVAERTRELETANRLLRDEAEARERAEAQMRQAQKMEAIGQLTGGIAHDFNNMLAIVVGSLDLARRRLERGDAEITPLVDNAMDGARRGAELTQRLLAFSRLQPLAPAVSDLNLLVRGISELLRRTLGEAVALECVLAGGLWRAKIDRPQLESAILNLAVNARDAMPEGGRLTVETQNAHLDDAYAAAHPEVTAGQYVMVAVSDTGEGMAGEVAAKAFDPFFTTKAPGRGTGLGLSQVYGFVKQSGGHVKIYSEPGQGTTVRIYLPRAQGEVAEALPPAAAAVPRAKAGESILVVEDEAGVRLAAVGALREFGYEVHHAGAGEAALALLNRRPGLTLLFTDVVMPGMTGRVLADRARAIQPGLRVLYTTGYTANAIVHNGVVDAGVRLLAKPYALDELARKVRQAIDEG